MALFNNKTAQAVQPAKKEEKCNIAFVQQQDFTTVDYDTASLIQQRRLQMLIHSRIYYELNDSVISDEKWQTWAYELVELQQIYPQIAEKVCFAEAFKDWDGTTGAFLPLNDPWVVKKAAHHLYSCKGGLPKVDNTKQSTAIQHKKVQQSTGNNSGKKNTRKSNTKQRSNDVPERRRLFG